jgi:CHAT domain-containing protein
MKAIIHAPQEKGGSSPESVLGAAQGVLPGTVALDEAFTLQALERGLRARPQMVHIASHFKFKPGDETDSFLLLGEGTLSLDKLMLLRFSGVDLLTLSACDTAMGSKGADGREVESFAEQAQVHGAGAVLASLWPLADASTPLLMRLFYSERERDGGTTKAQALQSAQLALLRGGASGQVLGGAAVERGSRNDEAMAGAPTNAGAPFAHPYFWAPFVLIGNWR